MLNIEVLFFAVLKDIFGAQSVSLRLLEPISVQDLLKQIAAQKGKTVPQNFPIRYALNQNFVDGKTLVQDGDCVAYLPPMSGG